MKTLADKCKWFEKNFSPEKMIPELPVILRLDGENFSTWSKDFNKPFDEGFANLMVESAKFLCGETNAIISYVCSDEITLILYSDSFDKAIYNDGKKQKIISKLTGKLGSYFNDIKSNYVNNKKLANFDCRIYQVPTLEWATKQLLWREYDATKNSISMLAQANFLHKSLQNLNGSQMQDKLMVEKGINWNDLPAKFKRGTYVQRKLVSTPFTSIELDNLPEKHRARQFSNESFERHVVSVVDMPIFSKIQNKIDVVFNCQTPILYADK